MISQQQAGKKREKKTKKKRSPWWDEKQQKMRRNFEPTCTSLACPRLEVMGCASVSQATAHQRMKILGSSTWQQSKMMVFIMVARARWCIHYWSKIMTEWIFKLFARIEHVRNQKRQLR